MFVRAGRMLKTVTLMRVPRDQRNRRRLQRWKNLCKDENSKGFDVFLSLKQEEAAK